MRIQPSEGTARQLHVIRRNGEVVAVPECDVVKFKLIPAAGSRIRIPAAWSDNEGKRLD
jgi:hypothetical protein